VPLEADRDLNLRREGWRRGLERGWVLEPPAPTVAGWLVPGKFPGVMTALSGGQEASGPLD
jgi:hypothetical protein